MAVSVRVRRVANPRGRRRRKLPAGVGRTKSGRFVRLRRSRPKRRAKTRRTRRVRRNPVVRRRVAVRRRTQNTRRGVVRRNSTTRQRARNTRVRRKTRKTNPVLVELGMINPNRRRSRTVARKANRRRSRRRVSRRRRNPVAVVTSRRRSVANRGGGRRRRVYSRRRRNPMGVSPQDMVVQGVGGLVGVALTKFLPTLIPANLMSTIQGVGTPAIMSVAITAAGAFAAGFIGNKINPAWGRAILLGGLMQTASVALGAFAPSNIAGQLALNGVGDIIPTNAFPVPNNQMRPFMLAAPAGVSGVGAGMRRYRGR